MGTILLFILICFLCGNVYIFIHALQTLSGTPLTARIIFSLLFWLCAFSLFIAMSLRHCELPEFVPKIMFITGSTWLVFVLYMSLLLLATDITKHFFMPAMKNGFMYAFLITASILFAGYINHLHPKVNRIKIAIDKPITGDSMRIVAVSDLHLGYGTGKERLKQFVDMINAENPDIILIAGDLIDNSTKPLYKGNMQEELNMLKAPLGIYMVPGNHEYISGIENCKRFIEETPVKILFDSVVTLPNGVQLICCDDFSNRNRHPIEELMKNADNSRMTILLDHQPRDIAKKDAAKIDLQISGHTHNGQIWPGNIVTNILYEQSHGYRKWNYSHVYVSSGLSLWGPPFRIGTNSDIAVFTIYSTK